MKVKMMQVGPIGTNCYILEDEETRRAAVIDQGEFAEQGETEQIFTAPRSPVTQRLLAEAKLA